MNAGYWNLPTCFNLIIIQHFNFQTLACVVVYDHDKNYNLKMSAFIYF